MTPTPQPPKWDRPDYAEALAKHIISTLNATATLKPDQSWQNILATGLVRALTEVDGLNKRIAELEKQLEAIIPFSTET